jgi:hypothetical protein
MSLLLLLNDIILIIIIIGEPKNQNWFPKLNVPYFWNNYIVCITILYPKVSKRGDHHSVFSPFKSFKLNVCHHNLFVTLVKKYGFFVISITTKMIVESNPFVWNDYLCLISLKSKVCVLEKNLEKKLTI